MTFIMQLADRKGVALNEGDIVAISNGTRFTFYAEVKYLPEKKVISPFHLFSFHSFEKVESVPAGAIGHIAEDNAVYWSVPEEASQADDEAGQFDKYLADWRQCEHLLQQRCYRIEDVLNDAYFKVNLDDGVNSLLSAALRFLNTEQLCALRDKLIN